MKCNIVKRRVQAPEAGDHHALTHDMTNSEGSPMQSRGICNEFF